MLFVGLLLVVAAAVFAGVVLSENWGGATYTVDGFGHVLGHFTLAQVFLSGVILTAVFFVGLWVASISSLMRRRASGRRRADNRVARVERDALVADRDRLTAERDRLAADLDTARRTTPPIVVLDPHPAVVLDDQHAGYTSMADTGPIATS